jgi:hypothetical protein
VGGEILLKSKGIKLDEGQEMNATDTKPLKELCAELGITASVRELDGDLITFPDWAKQGWSIVLKYNKKRAQFRFYGGGKSSTPTASDLVWAVVIDSEALNESFKDWCDNFGYTTDSVKARATYKACQRNGQRLTDLIGNADVFSQLVESGRDY